MSCNLVELIGFMLRMIKLYYDIGFFLGIRAVWSFLHSQYLCV